jgi:hypothetical protein
MVRFDFVTDAVREKEIAKETREWLGGQAADLSHEGSRYARTAFRPRPRPLPPLW